MKIPSVIASFLEIAASAERFPIRRIYCVGQNYADHAKEMGSDSPRNPPFFFMKPSDAVVSSGTRLVYPSRTADLHHEVEMVVALSGGGSDIEVGMAKAAVFGWAVGLDLTRRDLQAAAKKAGRPWDMAKGFDHSAPVGPLVVGEAPGNAIMELSVAGQKRQSGNVADMIWSVSEIIAELSTYVELAAGDLIFTGTPAGVGPIRVGETVRGTLQGAPSIEVSF
jgi:fumarylpyruvate hydrolase